MHLMNRSDVKTNWTELSCLGVFGGSSCDNGRYLAEWTITKCWFSSMLNRVPDKHAAGNLMFTFIQVQVSDNHEVRK